MDWSLGISARGGVIFGSTVVYLHAGWMGSDFEIRNDTAIILENNVISLPPHRNDKFLSGFRTGIGFDTMLTDCISAGGEWSYTWYGNVESKTTAPTAVDRVKYDPETSVFRVNLKVKFKGIS